MANRYTSVLDMHTTLNLSTLHMRRNYHMAAECHRNIYFEGRASLGHFYVPIVRPDIVHTRAEHSKMMYVPRVRTVAGSKAISVRGPQFWNSVRSDLRIIDKLDKFKSEISLSAMTMFENHPT